MADLKIVRINGKHRHVEILVALSQTDRKKLSVYLDHLGISVATLTRRLLLDELLNETQLYKK